MGFKQCEVKIGGQTFFYWEKNPEKKETIVLLHGFPGNHLGLMEFASAFKGYRLIIPDLPACGKSQPLYVKKHNLKNYANWLNSFLDALNLNKTIIIGHSFGARLAIVFGSLYAEKIHKIVFIAPVLGVNGFISWLGSLEYKIAEILPEKLKKIWLSNGIYQNAAHWVILKSKSQKKRKIIIDRDKKEFENLDADATIEIFDDFTKINLLSYAKKINSPALVIAAGKDEIASIKDLETLAGKISYCQFKIIKNGGHIVPVESPKNTASLIAPWLSEPVK